MMKKSFCSGGIANKKRISGIDSVRAFAALSVALAHILGVQLPELLQDVFGFSGGITVISRYLFTGHPAVIAFFVISGFCIHYPYTNSVLPVLPFWAARWTRIIIPVGFAWVCAMQINMPKYNFREGYILWSIVCELYYYSLYPVFFFLSRFIGWKTQFYVALIISFIVVIVLGSNQNGSAHIYGPFLNWLVALPSWITGCVLAEKIGSGSYRQAKGGVGLWRLTVASVASLLYWLTINTPFGFYLTMNAFSLVVFFWLEVEIANGQKNRSSMFESIGKWSFSIYLFHMIIFNFLVKTFHLPGPLGRMLFLPVVLFVCYLLYLLVEKPSHRYAKYLFGSTRECSDWLVRRRLTH